MDDIERRLSALLHTRAPEPPHLITAADIRHLAMTGELVGPGRHPGGAAPLHRVRPWIGAVLSAAAVVLLIAASLLIGGRWLGDREHAAPATRTASLVPPPTPTPSTARTVPPKSASRGSTPPPARSAACVADDITITAVTEQPANRNGAVLLHFTNTGHTACTTFGYPGVAVLDAARRQQYQAVRQPFGYMGGLHPGQAPPHITLAPGQQASALVEYGLVSEPSGDFCPMTTGLLVTMPNDTTSTRVNARLSDCGSAAVDPIVPGATGAA